jgi:antitoxin PrlF
VKLNEVLRVNRKHYLILFGNTFCAKNQAMPTALTVKGQVTLPKHIRVALGLLPGALLDFAVNKEGDVVIQRADRAAVDTANDRFDAARGRADVPWRTDDLMALLRG